MAVLRSNTGGATAILRLLCIYYGVIQVSHYVIL